jgi:iron complex outermembrane receptor protein
MSTSVRLLGGAALLALAVPAIAADAVSAPAADAADAAAPVDAADQGEIVVLGFGRSRQIQSVTGAEIARLVPGTSPLKAISKLPGVNFQAADAFGAYEWATRISVRGFNQNQLGFTLDGVPLGDMSYGNVNGLHISRAIISENVGRVDVAQGAGALGTASTSNLGGTIEFFSRDPGDVAGIAAAGTYGSNDNVRGYVRLDSGDLGGLKGSLSYAYLDAQKWKGDGPQRQHQVNAKLVKQLGETGSVTGFVNFSDRRETDYQDLSYDIIRRRGYDDDNLTGQYALATRIAKVFQNQSAAAAGQPLPWAGVGVAFPAGVGTVDDGYADAGGLRRDWLTGLTFAAQLTPDLSFTTTGYYHDNKGQGSWITPYQGTPAGAPGPDGTPIAAASPLSFRTTEYSIHRGGVVSAFKLETGINTLQAGGWIESNSHRIARRFYGMADADQPSRDTLKFQDNPFATQWYGKYDTSTYQYHVEDSLKLLDDRLTLNAGWKGMQVTNRANLIVGTLARGEIGARDWFLPQAGIVFRATPAVELFADYTENMRAFTSSGASGPFATTQAGFDAIRSTLKPERSKTGEGGVRYRAGPLQASAVGYYVDFSNRLLAFSNGAGIIGNPATLNNVGSVQTYGAEVTANVRVLPPLSLFASYSYTHSTYRDDVLSAAGAVLVATRGRDTVDTPEHMVKGEIVYDDGAFMARIGGDYMSKRYFTYLNDQSVGGRVLVDASIGYTFHGSGVLDGLGISGNVTNLTDKRYIATIGSNGFTASGDNQTLLAGAPRQWFVTLRKGF